MTKEQANCGVARDSSDAQKEIDLDASREILATRMGDGSLPRLACPCGRVGARHCLQGGRCAAAGNPN